MSTLRRTATLLLAAALIASFAGCSPKETPSSSPASTAGDPASSGGGRIDIPEDEGEFTEEVTNMGGQEFIIATGWPEEYQEPDADSSESTVHIWEGIKSVEQDYNCTIKIRKTPALADVKTYIASGIKVGDIIQDPSGNMLSLIRQGYIEPLQNIPEFGLDSNPWPGQYIDFTTFFGKSYCFSFRYDLRQTLAFNKTLCEAIGVNPEDLYNMVYDGTWTFDKFNELCYTAYEKTGGKTAGVTMPTYNMERSATGFCLANGVDFLEDDGSRLIFNGTQEGITTMLNKLQKLYVDKLLIFNVIEDAGMVNETASMEADQKGFFQERKSLFYLGEYWEMSERLTENEDQFGLLPIPKGSEEIDEYIGLVAEGPLAGFVKGNADNGKMAIICRALMVRAFDHINTLSGYVESIQANFTDDQTIDMVKLQLANPRRQIFYGGGVYWVGDAVRKTVTGQATAMEAMEEIQEKTQIQIDENFALLMEEAAG